MKKLLTGLLVLVSSFAFSQQKYPEFCQENLEKPGIALVKFENKLKTGNASQDDFKEIIQCLDYDSYYTSTEGKAWINEVFYKMTLKDPKSLLVELNRSSEKTKVFIYNELENPINDRIDIVKVIYSVIELDLDKSESSLKLLQLKLIKILAKILK